MSSNGDPGLTGLSTTVEDTSSPSTMSSSFDRFCLDEYSSIVNALAWSLGGYELGREAADEAFARAFERWDRVAVMANPAGWVYRVGLNWGRRRLWRRNRERELLTSLPSEDVHVLHHHDPDLAAALADLPVKLRSVVVMRFLLDYSEIKTAQALQVSPGTVKSRLHRGLRRLREALEDSGTGRGSATFDRRSSSPADSRSDEESGS